MFTDYEGIKLAKIYADNPVHDHETPMQNNLGLTFFVGVLFL